MAEDMNRAIRERIAAKNEKAKEQEQKRLYLQEKARERGALVARLSSKGGMPIRELPKNFATEQSRRLLAGFVISAARARIPMITENSGGYKLYEKVGKNFKGWNVALAEYERSHYDGKITVTPTGVVTPQNGLYVSRHHLEDNYGRGFLASLQPLVVNEYVIATLAEYQAEWVEPDPATYK